MTNKISRDAAHAFHAGRNFKRSNTQVSVDSNGDTGLFLHGNCIAIKKNYGQIFIQTCGWNTVTTRARLNAIHGVHVQQKNWILYLNGELWDGNIIEVNA